MLERERYKSGLEDAKKERDRARWERNDAEYELYKVGKKREENDQTIGMLEHQTWKQKGMIERRDEELELARERLEQWKKKYEDQEAGFEKAFSHERKLADAERERQQLKEKGYQHSKRYVPVPLPSNTNGVNS